ncbi:hypothetical protein [Leclercia adecarboxylata]|uniref:hypothetical protein n=1 Tax=Leclercia adecarboxylata TaxID=83655 RepID=UPI00254D8B07|nr:hypothetical protein [Leclercia adecarboxylata]
MRELNQQEIENVSGAGFIADAAASLGMGIGKVVDTGLNILGLDPEGQATAAAETLGRGIGMIVETGVSVASSIFNKLFHRS